MHDLDTTQSHRDSRRDFLKTSGKVVGAGLALSTLGVSPIFAAHTTQATESKPQKSHKRISICIFEYFMIWALFKKSFPLFAYRFLVFGNARSFFF